MVRRYNVVGLAVFWTHDGMAECTYSDVELLGWRLTEVIQWLFSGFQNPSQTVWIFTEVIHVCRHLHAVLF